MLASNSQCHWLPLNSMGQDTTSGTGHPDTSDSLTDVTGVSSPRLVAAVAWGAVLLGTGGPVIIADEVFAADPGWLLPAQVVLLSSVLVLTIVDERFRALQTLALALLTVIVMRTIHLWDIQQLLGFSVSSEMVNSVANLLLDGVLALALLAILSLRGLTRNELFLQRSDLSATSVPERVPGFRRARPWRQLGAFWGATTVLTTIGFLLLAGARFALWEQSAGQLLVVGTLVVVAAAVNAFQEEFVFRAAPLSQLTTSLGPTHSAVLLGAAFGLSHYYGTPGGVPGVLMTLFLGWWLSKSVLETRGITFAWSVHFLLDVAILTAWFLT